MKKDETALILTLLSPTLFVYFYVLCVSTVYVYVSMVYVYVSI